MARPDVTNGDGWQIIDGTPQILSGGKYQCGPAPYSFVKNNAGGQYDVDFISSAVSAPVQYFSVNGGNTNLIETVYGCLGTDVITKKPGTNEWFSLLENNQ